MELVTYLEYKLYKPILIPVVAYLVSKYAGKIVNL
jgi:hypothetical protein